MEENFQVLRKEFQEILLARPDLLNEFDLKRGLQGHNNDTNYVRRHIKAHLRFLSCIDWEKFEKNPVLAKYYPWGFVGETGKNDTFLYLETLGRADPDGLLNVAPMSKILLNRLFQTENMTRRLREYENRTGRQAKLLFVVDMEEFALDSSWLSVLGRQFKIGSKFFSDRYSEILNKIVVVNCPTYVYYVWKIVHPLLPEMTRQKVELYSNDDWKEKLLQHVDADKLPAYWGGTMKDENGDAMCKSKIVVPPGKIPKNLLWHPSADDPKSEQFRQLAVSAGQFEYVDVKIRASDLREDGRVNLKWYFTASGDFSFGVFYRPDGDREITDDHMNMEMVYPFFDHLPGPTTVPEFASIECKKPGVYRLRFGNEMGWWYKLNINYHVQCSP